MGSLLFLIKHSRPDIGNAVHQLSKVMDVANNTHMEALHIAVKYVEQTKNTGLLIKPETEATNEVEMISYSDSDYTGNTDNRRSTTGFVVYTNNSPVSWRSKAQDTVTLSTTEAEYYALSHTFQELLFTRQIFEYIGMRVTLPMTIHVDNVGAIFLTENSNTGKRTRHIDVRYHHVREQIERGNVQVKFVRSKKMTPILSQRVSQPHYTSYTVTSF